MDRARKELMTPQEKLFPAYEKAINKLQDFFEYANESKSDREFVKGVLNQLYAECMEVKETQRSENEKDKAKT